MDLLNENSLASLLCNCYQNRGYEACILFNNNEDVYALLNEIMEIHQQNAIDGIRTFRRNNPAQIVFENRSSIRLLTISDEALLRGMRFHEALVHEDVMDANAMLILQSNIREYREYTTQATETATRAFRTVFQNIWKNAPTHSTINEEITVDEKSAAALDDFLKSFSNSNMLQNGS